MGIAANQARLMSLTARQSDLELKAQQISAIKMRLSQTSSDSALAYSKALNLYSAAKAVDKDKYYIVDETTGQIRECKQTDAGAVKGDSTSITRFADITGAQGTYDADTTRISAQEKVYDMELTQVNTEHNAIKTEYDAIKTLIGDNVEKSFNVFG